MPVETKEMKNNKVETKYQQNNKELHKKTSVNLWK